MRHEIEMKSTEGDISHRASELGDKATQLLTFLSFAIVSAVLSETAMKLNVCAQVVEESQRSAVEMFAAVLDPNGPKVGEKPSGEKSDCQLIQ